jgi:diguanylate cyclase (GGDEF)-like protein
MSEGGESEFVEMQQSIQDTLHRLLGVVEQVVANGARAYAVVRSGRFADLHAVDRHIARFVPANALDTIESPIAITEAPAALGELSSVLNEPHLHLYPARDHNGATIAILAIRPTLIEPATQLVIDSVLSTLAVLTDTLEVASQHASRSLHDSLTHLPNRAMFVERLHDELISAERTEAKVGMLTIDLDGFSEINAVHGRAFGDRVLQRVAARLHHAVRRTDLLARLGEDEFGLMAVQMSDQPEGAHVATRLLKTLSQPMELDGVVLNVSASVGIAVCPADGTTADALLANSLSAMHRAKIRGPNQFEYFTPQMNANAMERLDLEARLRVAIDRNQMCLNYQPIVDRHGHVTGVEALLRWTHPEHGPISPAKFVPVAEQTGMIVPIGTWVLRQAVQQAAQWALAGTPLRVNVNVSTLQFTKPDFVEIVFDAIRRCELDPSLLELELTESVFIDSEQEMASKLTTLRAAGVHIAIDDFGAGYSNLSRLHNLPIDTLKIDRAFVNEINVKDATTPLHHRTAVLRAMATLGNSLGLKLVAEGVETEDQVRFLKRIGYEAMQGYYFARPQPADEVMITALALGLAKPTTRLVLHQAA